MAEAYDVPRTHECDVPVVREEGVKVKDRFMGKKQEGDEKCHRHEVEVKEEVIAAEFEEKVNVYEEEEEEEKKHGLLEKLHRSDSTSSSSSDEEEDEEKKKKKKKNKKREKEEMKEEEMVEDTTVPIEKYEEEVANPPVAEEKKRFLEKITEKISVVRGHTKKADEVAPPLSPPPSDCNDGAAEVKEKRGLLEKIKEKLPGYHPKSQDDEKEKKKESACT